MTRNGERRRRRRQRALGFRRPVRNRPTKPLRRSRRECEAMPSPAYSYSTPDGAAGRGTVGPLRDYLQPQRPFRHLEQVLVEGAGGACSGRGGVGRCRCRPRRKRRFRAQRAPGASKWLVQWQRSGAGFGGGGAHGEEGAGRTPVVGPSAPGRRARGGQGETGLLPGLPAGPPPDRGFAGIEGGPQEESQRRLPVEWPTRARPVRSPAGRRTAGAGSVIGVSSQGNYVSTRSRTSYPQLRTSRSAECLRRSAIRCRR